MEAVLGVGMGGGVNIAIVTSCYNYGQYLDEWADSILALNTKPRRIVIVDNGSTDDSPRQIQQAAEKLRAAGLEVVTHRIERVNFGAARNVAVELAGDVEWVSHFDCDDTLMPFALDDTAELAPEADVIPWGYERTGDLKAGPKTLSRVYRPSRGESTLQSGSPASGPSPFRKKLWEQAPYPENMIGGWDTALWIGFAHLNARFVPTKRPVFNYRQHKDSIFNVRRLDGWTSALVGTKLKLLRRPIQGVSVVVPFNGDERRDRLWDYVRAFYERHFPDWQIVVGSAKPWRKGVAVNNALQRATGEVLVIADADCLPDPEALSEAVRAVMGGVPWVVPHTMVRRLDEETTLKILSGEWPEELGTVREHEGFAGGGVVVVDHAAFVAAGGIPEEFRGWGCEDEALAVILDTMLGAHVRLEHDLIHLYHKPTKRLKAPEYPSNKKILRHFLRAQGDPKAMWKLISRKRPLKPKTPALTRYTPQHIAAAYQHPNTQVVEDAKKG